VGLPAALPEAELPIYGALELPRAAPDAAPGGLTLDQAIERLIQTNLDLRAKAIEIPKADADILTASLRLNPLFFADVQQVPYGSFSERRPGGPTQYDINITMPMDLTGKRRARTAVACRAKRVVEALYQDAVRIQMDNLYTAYVDVVAASETLRYLDASLGGRSRGERGTVGYQRGLGLFGLLETAEQRRAVGSATGPDVDRVRAQIDAIEIAKVEAEETLVDAKRTLGVLLSVPAEQAETLRIRSSLADAKSVRPPSSEELRHLALSARPDLMAFRFGVERALADVDLAEANRLENLFLLAQPYTFQDNSPFDRLSAHSWAVGMTVPLPLFNRNQGNIQRARLNVNQTQIQLAELERRVIAEVYRAERAYRVTTNSLERLELQTIPAFLGHPATPDSPRRTGILEAARDQLESGDISLAMYLTTLREYNDVVRQYRDMLVRHRRAMLRLNTAVGQRVLP
jgi:cobalt-zinc-cadmium efflux system outer membrane protein